ncbi:MAG: class I SAM-dependent methyltransferase [Candidatus Nitricoxidivorans perseverans]|uniref:Class I SAM-dependent methyltransferase n=1 Tax=Candidatus Nitricoxidivorans perseverans TaxID=2975601 RepID=A0AA49IZ01_9PROT|nr:MAG: class I SAM-dependent methyltransferase [Candidatus Nitricoxidivorans perseverans]
MIEHTIKWRVKHFCTKWCPTLYFLIKYSRAARRLGGMELRQREAFRLFLSNAAKQEACLQIGVKDEFGGKFGANWVSVDKYDTRPFIDFQQDVQSLQFEDDRFGAIACIAVLEMVEDPQRAIQELYRVLKPGGEIWIQLPFNFPYMGGTDKTLRDYWRASPDGLRLWMRGFEEICCGNFQHVRSSLVNSTFYYGRKPQKECDSGSLQE